MYKLGKISFLYLFLRKSILKKVYNRKIIRTNTYMNSLTKKAIAQYMYLQTNKRHLYFRIFYQTRINS